MIYKNFLLLWKISFLITVIVLICNLVNHYIYANSGYPENLMMWLFFLLLFMTLALRFIADYQKKKSEIKG